MMQCPRCGLFNPDSAAVCDCGFRFSKRAASAAIPAPRPPSRLRSLGYFLALAVLFVGLFAAVLRSVRWGLTALLTETLLTQAKAEMGRPHRTPQEAEVALIKGRMAEIGLVSMPQWALALEVWSALLIAGIVTALVYRGLERRAITLRARLS